MMIVVRSFAGALKYLMCGRGARSPDRRAVCVFNSLTLIAYNGGPLLGAAVPGERQGVDGDQRVTG